MSTPPATDPSQDQPRDLEFPYVAVTVVATGIHPSTGRIVAIDAITFNDAGETGEDFHAVLNPGGDPGPQHHHGLSPADIAEGQGFHKLLKPLDKLIDGRTLIVHDTPFSWGFIVAEARRAMTAAARSNRARSRGRSRGRRRRQKVGHIPAPTAIIDTLETSRRQGVRSNDIRLAAVALASGLHATDPTASVERAQLSEAETSREHSLLLKELFGVQRGIGKLSSYAPDELRADRFGLQRSHVRIDAAEAPRLHHNPGPYQPGKELRRGMEVVVAPEITVDPDTIIAAAVKEELNYCEKLSRETSVVVCNVTTDLVGKPMHAHRKNIPLMSDEAFLAALERIEDAQDPEPEDDQHKAHVPNANQRRSGASRRRGRRRGQNKKRGGGNGGGPNGAGGGNRGGNGGTHPNNGGGNKNRNEQGKGANTGAENGSGGSGNSGGNAPRNAAHSGANHTPRNVDNGSSHTPRNNADSGSGRDNGASNRGGGRPVNEGGNRSGNAGGNPKGEHRGGAQGDKPSKNRRRRRRGGRGRRKSGGSGNSNKD